MATTTGSSGSTPSSSSSSQRRDGGPGLFSTQHSSLLQSQPLAGAHHASMPPTGPQPGNFTSHGLIHGPSFGSSSLMQFPPGSVEATSLAQQRRRRKLLTRDLIWVTPKRLTMALRSGLEFETIWAINALNVMLYDDTAPHFNLNAAPAILDLVIEHLRAVLEVLFPQTFEVI
jgi:hypothetical protein